MKETEESGATRKEWLATNLKRAREAARLTQNEAAEAAGGIHPANISDWERGVRAPNVWAMLQLADAYGISLDMLVKGEESPHFHAASSGGVGEEDLGAIRGLLKSAKRILQERPSDPGTASRVTATLEAAEMLTEN